MLAEFLNLNVYAFFLVFARIGTAMSLMPGFGAVFVSLRIRLAVAVAVAFVVTPTIAPDLPVPPQTATELGLLFAAEGLIGLFLGALVRALIIALEAAGTFIALFAALSNALIQDPIAEQQSSTISGFLGTVGLTLIFVTDLHHLMLRGVVDSYALFEPGQTPMVGDLTETLARTIAASFSLGLQLAAPALVIAITYYLGLGLISRLIPQLPVFFFGLPIQISVQLLALAAALSSLMLVFLNNFTETLTAFTTPLGP